MEQREVRTFGLELRDAAPDGSPRIGGYAAVYDSESVDLGGFTETIAPGAFDGVLEDDVRFLFNHNANYVLARTKAGNLDLHVDERGLRFDAELDMADPDAERVLAKVRSGVVDQCSFAFTIPQGGDVWEERDGTLHRRINQVDRLYDVSVVTEPAYPATSAYARTVAEAVCEFRSGAVLTDEEVEALQDAGLDHLIVASEPSPAIAEESPEAVEAEGVGAEEPSQQMLEKLLLATFEDE